MSKKSINVIIVNVKFMILFHILKHKQQATTNINKLIKKENPQIGFK